MSIIQNFKDIQKTIPDNVKLVAVSKRQPDEKIKTALDYGHRIYGENQIQEAQKRWQFRRAEYDDLQLHFIGSLQTNKAEDAVTLFDVIETIDRPKLVDALAKSEKKLNIAREYCIQINTGEESQKGGVLPCDLPALLEYTASVKLNVTGLMCIPPANEAAGLHFAFLKKLADQNGLKKLSMGMSADYQRAIKFGATSVRVGSALFGERAYY